VTPASGKRRRHNERTFFGTATPTVAVPAALARNIGQSSRAAGRAEAGAAQSGGDEDNGVVVVAGDDAGAAESARGCRGAMANVPWTCQQSHANGIQYKRPLAGTTPSKHPGRTMPS
jgi:hypothetical protein